LNKPLPLLRVENLVKHFPVRQGLFGRANGAVRAVDGDRTIAVFNHGL
jgi:ABC-type oligopeptide transport system ATPase subunit